MEKVGMNMNEISNEILFLSNEEKLQQIKIFIKLPKHHNIQKIVYSPPGSSVHGILQARILKWVAISTSRGSFQPRDRSQVSCIAGKFFTI